jgi:hypothetical protein
MKAGNANDAALESQPKPTTQKTTSFDTYEKAISDSSETQASTGSTETARTNENYELVISAIKKVVTIISQTMREKRKNLRG